MPSSPLKQLLNYDLLRGLQRSRVNQLNSSYIEVSLTVQGLRELRTSLEKLPEKQMYRVPRMRGGKREVFRKTSEILEHIDRRISYSEYAQSIVFAVALAEGFIKDTLILVLTAYPKKILISAKGNEGNPSIAFKDIIEVADVERLIVHQAVLRLNEVTYASPEQYAIYFESVTGFSLGDHLPKYIEIKATRDLLVHNDGIINPVYLEKAGELARGKLDDRININTAYFEETVRTLKHINSAIYRGMLDKYGESKPFADAVTRHAV